MRKLAFWVAFAGAALGTRWVLRQRPKARIPGPEDSIDRQAVQAYAWVARLPHFKGFYTWLAQRALWGVPATGKALDMRCGPGGMALELARQAPGLEVVGLDTAPEMLRAAAARGTTFTPRVTWRQGDAQALPFPKDSFNLVVSALSLHHFSRPLQALDEVARVLKPGGRFMLFDLRRDIDGLTWLAFWLGQHTFVPGALRAQGEPLSSLRASYTPREMVELAQGSRLQPWRVACGPFWLSLENANTP